MIARQLTQWLHQVAMRPQIIHLYGLRQTGKTTLMESFRENYPDSLYYPLYDFVTLRKYEGQPERWVFELEENLKKRPNGQTLHVFVDEIQKIPAFFQVIQGLHQQFKGKIKFWIWGSSARPLKRQRAETLAGRGFSKILWPLSQSEILKSESAFPWIFDPKKLGRVLSVEEPRNYPQFFSRCIEHSQLPEPYLLEDISAAQDILESYQATYLENEIRRENLVQDIGRFEQFLRLAASEDTEIAYDISKAKALGVSPHTIKNYYGILEDTFVCRRIPTYSKSFRVQVSKSPKIYFSDTGLARFISGERGIPTPGSTRFGKLLEGFVVNEILKQIEYHSLPWRLSYFRTKSGLEVDLIISAGSKNIAAEIKATTKVTPGDYQSLKTFMKMDRSIQHGIVFSRQSAPLQLEERIFNFPIWNL